jgi:hypothetical protein
MTTSTSPVVTKALEVLAQQTPARQAQYASYDESMSVAHALGILRQLRCTETDSAPADPIRQPRGKSDGSSNHETKDASEAQARYAVDLLRTRVEPSERVTGSVKTAAEVLALFEASGRMSRDMARNIIDSYRLRPRPSELAPKVAERSQPSAPVELKDGIYRLGDTWYKVVHAVHGSGRQYAKRIVIHKGNASAEFVYEGSGPLSKLTEDHRVSLEEARQFGELYGCCVKCGATLTDEESQADMMGPVCSGRTGTAAKRAIALAYWK